MDQNNNFKVEQYPRDIVEVLFSNESEKTKTDLEEALYQIKAITENELNFNYWRILYKSIEKLSDNMQDLNDFIKELEHNQNINKQIKDSDNRVDIDYIIKRLKNIIK